MFAWILLYKDIFADFNPILVEISRFAQNSISSGVEGVVEKVPVTGKMIPLGVDLHTGEIAGSLEMESHCFQAFFLHFRISGQIQGEAIQRIVHSLQKNVTVVEIKSFCSILQFHTDASDDVFRAEH